MNSIDDFSGARAIVTDSSIVLENSVVRRVLEKDVDVWRTRLFSRSDGSDEVEVRSDEFLILLMNGTRLKIDDYQAQSDPVARTNHECTLVEITYVLRDRHVSGAPSSVLVRYILGNKPYIHKVLTLAMVEGQTVDRLEVERFKTQLPCAIGGIGQPVFIGDAWFVGFEYTLAATGNEAMGWWFWRTILANPKRASKVERNGESGARQR